MLRSIPRHGVYRQLSALSMIYIQGLFVTERCPEIVFTMKSLWELPVVALIIAGIVRVQPFHGVSEN